MELGEGGRSKMESWMGPDFLFYLLHTMGSKDRSWFWLWVGPSKLFIFPDVISRCPALWVSTITFKGPMGELMAMNQGGLLLSFIFFGGELRLGFASDAKSLAL